MRQIKLRSNLLPLTMAILTLLSAVQTSAQTDRTLYSFTGGADGDDPLSNLVLDKAGNLYGTTFVGGAYGYGDVFELKHNASGGWMETDLYSFTGGLDGANPYFAGVIADRSGNLYGTTVEGGTSNLGTVFELTPNGNGWSETVLYSFAGGDDGQSPYAGLTFDVAGNLYGTTYEGGTSGDGTVFELKNSGEGQWNETVIHAFNGTDGNAPAGGVVLDGRGNVYGVTQGGGNFQQGVAYQLVRSSTGNWMEKLLHSFGGGSDGSFPYAEKLVFDKEGNLYGTTNGGGLKEGGTVFEFSRSAVDVWNENVLYNFDGKVAANPNSGLIFDSEGSLYGTCANGNSETTLGAVFELTPTEGKWTERNVLFFTGPNGQFPEGSLVVDRSGNLYGTTWLGGTSGQGLIFELIP
jgi:uncharacterized repeat protein (TIGR03803 family)